MILNYGYQVIIVKLIWYPQQTIHGY